MCARLRHRRAARALVQESRRRRAVQLLASFQVNCGRPSQKRIRKTFRSLGEAKAWRQGRRWRAPGRHLRASDGRTVKQCGEVARGGAVRTCAEPLGDVYKPSAIRAYDSSCAGACSQRSESESSRRCAAWTCRILSTSSTRRAEPSTVLCSILPLKAIYRRAVARGEAPINPTSGLEMPGSGGSAIGSFPEQGASFLTRSRPTIARCGYAMYAAYAAASCERFAGRTSSSSTG